MSRRDGARRVIAWGLLGLALAGGGCASRKSSLLYERQARGPLGEEQDIARSLELTLQPMTQTKTEGNIEITVTHAHPGYLKEFFANRAVFGAYAGRNPYFPEQLVFYVKIANHSGKTIGIDPNKITLLDDRGNQYQPISGDYINALADAKTPVSTFTRGVLDDARPGYFGFSLPVGKLLGKSMWRFALLKMSSLQGGPLHDGVVYDGLVAFWSPHEQASALKLVFDVKTAYGPDDLPTAAAEVPFDVSVTRVAR